MLARVIAIATCPSVRLSVCLSRASIVSSPKTLVFWRQISPPNSKGVSKNGGSEKFSDFLALSVNISKTVADTAKVTISD